MFPAVIVIARLLLTLLQGSLGLLKLHVGVNARRRASYYFVRAGLLKILTFGHVKCERMKNEEYAVRNSSESEVWKEERGKEEKRRRRKFSELRLHL